MKNVVSLIFLLASMLASSMLSASHLHLLHNEVPQQNEVSQECLNALFQLNKFITGQADLDTVIHTHGNILTERDLLILKITYESWFLELHASNPDTINIQKVRQVFGRVKEELQKRINQAERDNTLLYTADDQLRMYARGEHPLSLNEIIESFDKYLSLDDLKFLFQHFFEQSYAIIHDPHSSRENLQFAIKLLEIAERLLRILDIRDLNPDND